MALRQNGTTRGPWSQTHTGGMFHQSDPTVDEVKLEDIAVALAKQVRYNGHTLGFDIYSVAQHAVLVSLVVEELGGTLEEIYWGLHHDDAEAYTGDIVTQIKASVPELRVYLKKIEPVVAAALGLEGSEPALVKHADLVMLSTEKRDIMAPKALWVPETWGQLPEPRKEKIEVMTPREAHAFYMMRHHELITRGAADFGRRIFKEGDGCLMLPTERELNNALEKLNELTGGATPKSATKDDGGKPMVYSLFLAYFPRAIREVARVSEYGMKKYNAKPGDQGYRKVPDAVRRYGDGLVRHLLDEITGGPVNEKDGGLLHLAQQAWNAMARLEIALEEKEREARDAKFDDIVARNPGY